ncbi:MAG: ABC transporter permease [Butyrivibrio sp.]|nr:ABC transporter permease [Acetatifactor muris]MCM1561397.1 ABC transporter permease [Butyrivibrio sp.]
MELFRLEHKKLWRKAGVRVSVALCFVYIVIFGNILSLQWFVNGSSHGAANMLQRNFDGYSMIRAKQEYARGFGGELTDESLRRMVRDYQRMTADGAEDEMEKTDVYTVNSWLGKLWPELRDAHSYQTMMSYVDPEKLTGFYERRQQLIETSLESNGYTDEEKEYLLQMEQKVKKPFRYEWADGWLQLLSSMVSDLGLVMALFLAISLSGMFAGEWHDNAGPLVLTTKNGWEKLAHAKILVGVSFALELFTMLAVGGIASQLFFFGTSGWDMPVQTIRFDAVAPMNMLQAEIYEYVFALLGAVGFAGVVMLLSAAMKSHVTALLLSLAVVYGPMAIDKYLPYAVRRVLDFIPLAGNGTEIFRTNTFHLFGNIVWSPYLLVSIPVLIGILCMPAAVKRWSRRGKA